MRSKFLLHNCVSISSYWLSVYSRWFFLQHLSIICGPVLSNRNQRISLLYSRMWRARKISPTLCSFLSVLFASLLFYNKLTSMTATTHFGERSRTKGTPTDNMDFRSNTQMCTHVHREILYEIVWIGAPGVFRHILYLDQLPAYRYSRNALLRCLHFLVQSS